MNSKYMKFMLVLICFGFALRPSLSLTQNTSAEERYNISLYQLEDESVNGTATINIEGKVSAYHPCLCTSVDYENDEINGISLINGSTPRSCSLMHCGIRKLSLEEAILLKKNGPSDASVAIEIALDRRWW